MASPLQVLLIEDSESDAELCIRQIQKAGFVVEHERVETADALKTALNRQGWDVIISDYALPGFSAPAALQIYQESGLDIPFIVVSGTITEETAIGLMRAGASDYLMKDRLMRLGPLIRRELNVTQVRRERSETLAGLHRAEQWSKLIYNTTSDAMFLLAVEGVGAYRCLTVNAAFYRSTGFVPDQVVGRRVEDVLRPASAQFFLDQYARVVQSGKAVTYEESIDLPHGQVFFTTTLTPVLDADGRCTHLLGSSREITDYKQAERLYRESETNFRQMVERSGEIFYRQNIHTAQFEYVSPRVFEVLGYQPEEWLGWSLEQQIANIHPEDLAQLENFRADLLRADAGREEFIEREFRIRHRAGHFCWMHGNYAVVRAADGSPLWIVGSLVDITRRKAAEELLKTGEERFRSMVENAYDLITLLDSRGHFVFCNPSYENILGYAPAQLLGRNGFDIVYPDDQAELQDKFIQVLADPSRMQALTAQKMNCRIRHADGSYRWVEHRFRLLLDEAGQLSQILVTAQDITEQKLALEALAESEQRFRLVSEMVSDWATLFKVLPDGTLQREWVTGAYDLMVGKTAEERDQQGGVYSVIHPDDQAAVKEALKPLLLEKRSVITEYRIIDAQGKIHWTRNYIRPVLSEPDQIVTHVVGVGQDITERKQAEAKINEQMAELRRWNNVTLGREERILELKKEVNLLLAEMGLPPRYASTAEPAHE